MPMSLFKNKGFIQSFLDREKAGGDGFLDHYSTREKFNAGVKLIQRKIMVSHQVKIPQSEQADCAHLPTWTLHLDLNGPLLKTINPIPLIMNTIIELEGANNHWHNIYIVLTELFINALDHGVLGLSSLLKNPVEGFSQYTNERAKRMYDLNDAYVQIILKFYPLDNGARVSIDIKDSGQGFDVVEVFKSHNGIENLESQLSGRGIKLVNQLCDTLEYQDRGTSVSANYLCHKLNNTPT